jgi:hydrogenase maturation factor
MIVCVAPEHEAAALASLAATGETAQVIGEVISAGGGDRVRYLNDW